MAVTAGGNGDREAHALLARPRLVQLCGDAAVLVLAAPGGFGKSSLAEQLTGGASATVRVFLGRGDATTARLASRLRDACRAADLDAVAESGIGADDPRAELTAIVGAMSRSVREGAWLVVEDAHVLGSDALAALVDLVDDLTPSWRVVVTGRSVPASLPNERRLGADDLVFSSAETQALLQRSPPRGGEDAEELAVAITRECEGWPAAIGIAVASTTRGHHHHRTSAGIEGLVAELVQTGPQLSSRALAVLGHLPVVSDGMGAALGLPDLISSAVAAGLPLRDTGRWWRLADPVREQLSATGPIDDGDLVTALGVIFNGGETTLAIDLLFAADRPAEACRLLASMPFGSLDELDVDETAALLDAVPDLVVAVHPRCLAQLARAAESRVRITLRARLLQRLSSIVSTIVDPVIERELEAELVCDLDRDSLVEEADRRGRALLAATPRDELITRARCLRALGRTNAWRGDARSLVDAAHLLAEATGAARAIGHDAWVADALCTLGYSVHLARGDFDLAVARMREGIDLLGSRSRRRAVQLTFLAEALTLLGRDDDAIVALAEARSIARIHADERILGYAAWTQARVVARRRDVAATLRWLAEAERNPGDWLDHPTGTQFLAEAAEISAMVGAEQIAEQYLARAVAQAEAQGWPEIPEAATGALAARFGDGIVAEQLLTLERVNAYRNATNLWHASLLIAHARLRRGDLVGARAKALEVIEQLEALGHPEFAMLHEPEIWPGLIRVLDGDSTPTVKVTLLGGFRVEVDGDEVVIPSGRPAQVVKVLALAGRPLPIDELVESLWPETEPDVGRRRLRNVLARVRAVAPLLDRSEGVLALEPTAVVDSQVFERLAQLAATAPPEQQLAAADGALAHYAGELLPADRFEEWSVAPRERIQRRAIRLLHQIVDVSVQHGDHQRAADAAERLLVLDPYDDDIAGRVGHLMRSAGRLAAADEWAARAAAIRRELGLSPS